MGRKALTSPDPSSNDSIGSSPDSQSANILAAAAAAARQPLSRRGHFKSRLGCFSCKRRRVKCNELRPECSPCRRLGLSCAYPTTASTGTPSLRANPTALALDDLRFYHQFLTVGYPTLPLRADKAWAQCAAMSHQHECLAHAILGLGASHVSQNCDADYNAQALQHRVRAIKLVNEQFEKPPKDALDKDILFGTVVCLLAQSSLMADSMVEYLTMTRGANLVATTIITDFSQSIFGDFTFDGHEKLVKSIVVEHPKDDAVVEAFRASILSLEPLCRSLPETRFLQYTIATIDGLRISSFEAWRRFVPLYVLPATFTNQEFVSFISPQNYVGHILAIHMFLLEYMLGQFCIAPAAEPKCPGRKFVIISWTQNLVNTIPPEFHAHLQWPLQYCEVLAKQDSRYLLSP